MTFIEKCGIIYRLRYFNNRERGGVLMISVTKRELMLIILSFLALVGVAIGVAFILLDMGIIEIPKPEFSLVDERVSAKEVVKAEKLGGSAHTESVLIAKTIEPGIMTEIKANYLLNDGAAFYATTKAFTPGENDAPSAKSILEYDISHSMTDLESVVECKKAELDPEITAVIVTWYRPVNDGYARFSLMDYDADGSWDLVANEAIKFADSDEDDAKMVYSDGAGHKIYVKYERAKELDTSDITFSEAESLYLNN